MSELEQEKGSFHAFATASEPDETAQSASRIAKSDVVKQFPQLAQLEGMNDSEREEAFSSVLSQLHRTLDEVTGR